MPKQDKPQFHKLLWLAVAGGFMDGLRVEFAPGLNCIIGGRGAGKTTFLELIRYALNELPEDRQSRAQFDALIDRNLCFGRVELGIETSSGTSYIVSRADDDPPVVLTEDRKPTNLVLGSGGLFKADIFSQNEVESIADRSDSQLALIDSFNSGEIVELTSQATRAAHDVTGLSKEVTQLQYKIATLRELVAEFDSVEEQLKGMAAMGAGNAGAINTAHARKSLRDRERRAVDQLIERLDQHLDGLETWRGIVAREAEETISQEMLTGPNAGTFKKMREVLTLTNQAVDELLTRAMDDLNACGSQVQFHSEQLKAAHADQEEKFRALIEKQNIAQGEAAKRTLLERKRNDLLIKKQELKNEEDKLAKIEKQRIDILGRMAEFRDIRYAKRKAICERLTREASEIRVTVAMDGNNSRYRAKLDELLRGSHIQDASKEKIIANLFPDRLVQLVRAGNTEGVVEKTGLTTATAAKLIACLSGSDQLYELETVELVDEPKIELQDGNEWKDSRHLSTGQKCTAILPILLVESEKPLLIDQPEDNLDNRYVSDKIVKTITRVKKRRQLIFVTHNPNIPVLGDAEQVIVLESSGVSGRVCRHGSVDHCKKEIISLLEGGQQAFDKRAERYRQ